MVVEDDIKNFEEWAENLGCPSKLLPPKKTLNRIFCSGQMLAFNELMRRVRPQQEVTEIRDEVKVRKIERLSGKAAGVKKIQSDQLYLYQTKKKLEERLQAARARVATQKQQYKKLALVSKENNIQKLQLKEEIANITAKNAISKLKISETERQIAAEKEIGRCIDEITPVKFIVNNGIDESATEALSAANAELQSFYSSCNQTDNYDVNMVAHQQLWKKLRETFAQIPNLVLWSNISDQMKQKLSTMETLSLMDIEKVLYVDADYDDPNQKNNLQIDIGKLHAKHIKLCIQRHGINKQIEDSNEYVIFYESFLKDIRSKFMMYNNQRIDDNFLGDYLGIYSSLYYGKGEIEFLVKAIGENELKIQRQKKYNEEYRIANMELTNIYDDMENLYVRTHEDIHNLMHVRDKIQHNEELMRYLLQCKKDQQQPALGGDGRLNSSANSSFGSNNDSVLCSTRSDSFNSTPLLGRSDVNTVRSMSASGLTNQLNEIKTFFNTPIDKFKLRCPSYDHLDLCLSPLVPLKVYNQLPNEAKTLIFDHMITPAASIKKLQSQVDWFSQIAEIQQAFVAPNNLPEVDESKLTAQKKQQDASLAEVTDETGAICANVHRIFENIQRYIQFINENPLRKYISSTEKFNGKTYQDYEREFMMYYKMIQKPEDV